MFIPLMRILLQSLVSRSFLSRLRYSFFIFIFLSSCLVVSASLGVFTPALACDLSLEWYWISRTILSILVNLSKTLVWVVLILTLISISYSPFSKLLGTVRAHQLQLVLLWLSCSTAFSVLWQCPGIYILFRFLLFSLWGPPEWHNQQDSKLSFFLFVISTKSGLLAGIRWSVCISKYQRILCVSFS